MEERAQVTDLAQRTAERDRLWTLSQDMLAMADDEGMMSAVSPAWTRVLGWSEAELLSRPYATFMHPEDMEPTLAALARMGDTGYPARVENRIATADEAWRPIEWTVASEPGEANFIAIGRDVSAVKQREPELGAARDALRQSQKLEAVGQLTCQTALERGFSRKLCRAGGPFRVRATYRWVRNEPRILQCPAAFLPLFQARSACSMSSAARSASSSSDA